MKLNVDTQARRHGRVDAGRPELEDMKWRIKESRVAERLAELGVESMVASRWWRERGEAVGAGEGGLGR